MSDAVQPGRASFAAAVGSAFRLSAGAAWTRPAELTDLSDAPPLPGWERFARTIRVAGPGVPPQDSCRLAHDVPGAFERFMVPVGQDPWGTQMEAVFKPAPGSGPTGGMSRERSVCR